LKKKNGEKFSPPVQINVLFYRKDAFSPVWTTRKRNTYIRRGKHGSRKRAHVRIKNNSPKPSCRGRVKNWKLSSRGKRTPTDTSRPSHPTTLLTGLRFVTNEKIRYSYYCARQTAPVPGKDRENEVRGKKTRNSQNLFSRKTLKVVHRRYRCCTGTVQDALFFPTDFQMFP